MWSDKEPDVITNNILTNQSDRKDTWGSDRSRPGTPDIHEGCAEDDNDYTYKTPNYLAHSNQDTLQHCETYCQEIGLVALMFFFELLFSLCFLAISLYVYLTNLFSIILFFIC